MGGRGGSSGMSGVPKHKDTQLTESQIKNLKGTKKQVEWATDIINDAYRQVDGIINAHLDSLKNGKFEHDLAIIKAVQDVKNNITSLVNKFDDASIWIKKREMFYVDNLNDLINRVLRDRKIPVDIIGSFKKRR